MPGRMHREDVRCVTDKAKGMSIKIVKDGPYLVRGDVPLREEIITPVDEHYVYSPGRELPQRQVYSLCRCGKSGKQPFCDATHSDFAFDGTETASRETFASRAEVLPGPSVDLLDDGRCAYARFCYRDAGNAWDLLETVTGGHELEEGIRAASECPAGRLVARDKEGKELEDPLEPCVSILQDPEKGLSCAIFVKGYVPIESSDGHVYEPRNRVALCRCGHSRIKPFCDAAHVEAKFAK